jgi:monofunctional biosynthetic peptidoglycan transglycosylase
MNDSPMPPPGDSAEPPRKGFFRRHLFLSTLGLIGSLALAFAGYVAYLTVSLPSVEYLRSTNPDSTSLMQQRADEARTQGKELRHFQYWVPLDRISENVVQAVRMGEDAAFFTHPGFDLHELRESVRRNFEEGEFARGASTITQQLAKNLFLSTEKSLNRKLKEAILTYRLERALSKKRILEIYLNVIEWGDGVYGIEAAARTYFGKSAAYLDPAEAAFLAAMIPNPRQLNPTTRFDSVKRGQERILVWMSRVGFLSDEELEAARTQELRLRVSGPT